MLQSILLIMKVFDLLMVLLRTFSWIFYTHIICICPKGRSTKHHVMTSGGAKNVILWLQRRDSKRYIMTLGRGKNSMLCYDFRWGAKKYPRGEGQKKIRAPTARISRSPFGKAGCVHGLLPRILNSIYRKSKYANWCASLKVFQSCIF